MAYKREYLPVTPAEGNLEPAVFQEKGARVLVHKHITSPLSRTYTVPLAKTNRFLFAVIYVRAPAVGYELRN